MYLPKRSTTAFWGLLACLAIVALLRIDVRARSTVQGAETAPLEQPPGAVIVPLPEVAGPSTVTLESAEALPPAPEPTEILYHVTDTLRRDGSVYLTLKAHDVPELEIARVGQALVGIFDAQRESHPGDVIVMVLDSLRTVLRFEYTPVRKPELPVLIERVGDDLQGRRDRRELTHRMWAIEVVIEDNLSNAISAAAEGGALTDFVVDYVFGSVIDFHKDPRPGDRLGLVFERDYLGDRFIRYGKVLLARYQGKVISQLGVRYEDPTGQVAYYDEDGTSLERMFLLKPMEFRRISSRFNRRRFHPILKRNVPHLGTDYAAASGTDVWATARGRVTVAGWNGGYGKMVEVEHPNGYRTRYAHLSRVQVRLGQRINKRHMVGKVGATGRATGPHLHYELIHNGSQIDPATVNRGDKATVLPAAYRDAFQRDRRYREGLLDNSRRVSAQVVADAAQR